MAAQEAGKEFINGSKCGDVTQRNDGRFMRCIGFRQLSVRFRSGQASWLSASNRRVVLALRQLITKSFLCQSDNFLQPC